MTSPVDVGSRHVVMGDTVGPGGPGRDQTGAAGDPPTPPEANPDTMPDHLWDDLLRAAGLRATRPRRLVAHALAELGGHCAADEVLDHLHAAGTPLPRASVYNSLDALVEAGIARPAFHGPGRALYEIADEDHDHFVCTRCDEILDIPRRGSVPRPPAPLVVLETAVLHRGLCPACA